MASFIQTHRSALTRVPVEVWNEIVTCAFWCPVLPCPDDSMMDSFFQLYNDCELIPRFMGTERERLRLRLVSRAFKEIVDRHPHRMMTDQMLIERKFIDYLVPCTRLEFTTYGWPICPERCPICTRKDTDVKIPSGQWGIIQKDHVMALLDPAKTAPWGPALVPKLFPRLRVLTLNAGLYTGETHPMDRIHISAISALSSITHLALHEIHQCPGPQSRHILDLPTLEVLFLHVTVIYDEFSVPQGYDYPPFGSWKLPALRRLGITVDTMDSFDSSAVVSELQVLIIKTGKGLKGLSLEIFHERIRVKLLRRVWAWCPQLQELGLSICGFYLVKEPPPNYPPINIVIMDPKDLSLAHETPSADLVSKIARFPNEILRSVTVPLSWTAFYRELRSDGVTPHAQTYWREVFRRLGNHLKEKKIPFLDRYGTVIGANGRLVVDYLQI